MKKMILSPLFLFLLACHNEPAKTNDPSVNNSSVADYSADSTKKWTRNLEDFPSLPADAINFTDANNLKQGKWVIIENGKVTKTQYYKDGKLVKGC
jgi:hypothetical protein